jgi:hypothetical protein
MVTSWRVVEKPSDQGSLRLDAPGTAVAAERPGTRVALPPLQRAPAADARRADAETSPRGSMARPRNRGGEDAGSKVERKG